MISIGILFAIKNKQLMIIQYFISMMLINWVEAASDPIIVPLLLGGFVLKKFKTANTIVLVMIFQGVCTCLVITTTS